MDSAYQLPDQVHRTRQLALLLGDADRATLMAYAAELESAATLPSPERQANHSGRPQR